MSTTTILENVTIKEKSIEPSKLSSSTDDAWKDILHKFFKEFIEFFCPDIYQIIDWDKGFEFLDKEFQSLIKHEKKGKRLADKLVKVWHKELGETFLLIHVEIQDGKELGFSLRMYNYYYRIWDRYGVPVFCLAVLLDKDKSWRPNVYKTGIGNCHLKFSYPVIKLVDYESQVDFLEKDKNPFALIVLCQLAASKSKENVDLRESLKFQLTKKLFKNQWNRNKIFDLYKFLDGILRLPEEIESKLIDVLKREEPKMSYVTSIEYFAEKRGIEQGIEQGIEKGEARILLSQLETKFKAIPQKYKQQIKNANQDILLTWANRLLTAKTIEEIFA